MGERRRIGSSFERTREGHEPKLRPINNGPAITKIAFQTAIGTPSVKAAIANLQPQQLGLGATNGPERMAHAARATYEAGGIVVTTDAANAFNSIRRQAIIDAVHHRIPRASRLVNTFYGIESPCIYRWRDDNGNTAITIIPSQEGVRAGCVLGSLAYGCTLDPVYKTLDTLFSRMTIKALTDDCVALFSPPTFLNNATGQRNWDGFYSDCAQYRTYLRQLS